MPVESNYSEQELKEIWNADLESSFLPSLFILPIGHRISSYLFTQNCTGELLDIGCSNGSLTSVFDKIGFKVTAIDGDAKRIAKAKAAFPHIDFSCFMFKDRLPFADNSFDVIFSSSVFQYLDHKTILSECKRVLKKGGSIILIENLKNNPITRSGRAYLKLTKHQYHSYPWNHFTLSELNELGIEFKNPTIEVFHLFSPVVYLKILRKLSPLLTRLDRSLLRIGFVKKYAWLALFTGEKK